MRVVLQRVKKAAVDVENRTIAEIQKGLLVFLGIGKNDTKNQVDWLTNKIWNLRIFEDKIGKMNLSIKDIKGEILLISQFTLYANCQRGRRPDFIEAAQPEFAEKLYEDFFQSLLNKNIITKKGIFGAHMDVTLINDGPVTMILER